MTPDILTKRIQAMTAKFVIPDSEYISRTILRTDYDTARVTMIRNEDLLNEAMSSASMQGMLPHQGIPPKYATPDPISKEQLKKIDDQVRNGKMESLESMEKLREKMYSFARRVQVEIDAVVAKEIPIMQNSLGVPFLENGCCSATGGGVNRKNALDYFIAKNSEVKFHNDVSGEFHGMMKKMMKLQCAPVILDIRDTKIQFNPIPDGFSDKSILKFLVNHCKHGESGSCPPAIYEMVKRNKDESDSDVVDRIIKNGSHDMPLINGVFNRMMIQTSKMSGGTEATEYDSTNIVQKIKSLLERDLEDEADVVPTQNSDKIILKKWKSLPPEIIKFLLGNEEVAASSVQPNSREKMRNLKNYLVKENNGLFLLITDFIKKNSGLAVRDVNLISKWLTDIHGMHVVARDEVGQSGSAASKMNFISDCIAQMTIEFPNMVATSCSTTISVPKHWKISDIHKQDMQNIMNSAYSDIGGLYGDKEMKLVCESVVDKGDLLHLLSKTVDISTDVELNILFHEFLLMRSFVTYTEISARPNFIVRSAMSHGETNDVIPTLLMNVENDDATDTTDDAEMISDTMLAVEQGRGDVVALRAKVGRIMGVFAKTAMRQWEYAGFTYEKMHKQMKLSRDKEKTEITDYLKKMSDEERNLETSFKSHKLGRWNVGLQKGLTKYVGDTYDAERGDGLDGEMGGIPEGGEEGEVDDAENYDISDLNEEGDVGGDED
jgi:hypothetical protein